MRSLLKHKAAHGFDPSLPWQGRNFVSRDFHQPKQLLEAESSRSTFKNFIRSIRLLLDLLAGEARGAVIFRSWAIMRASMYAA